MKRLASLVLITGLLAGCNVPLLTSGGKPPVGSGVNQPAEPLAGITFKPISAANARLIGSGGNIVAAGGGNAIAPESSARATAPASAPMAGAASDAGVGLISNNGDMVVGKSAPNPGSTAGGAYSGNIWGHYGYGHYFSPYGYGGGGAQEPMALVSITEAETGGGKGSFQDVIKNVTAPVIKAWAADGRLVSSSALLGSDGQIFVDPNASSARKPGLDVYGGGYYGEQPGWRLSYLSPTRNEMLSFYVTPQKTLIVRMRWAPLSLSPENVTVDSASAIKKLIAAIEDKNARGEEEKSGLDYFLGTPFDQPQTPKGDGNSYKSEVVYDVPDKVRWNVSLQSVMGRMVWELNYYGYEGPAYPAGGEGVIASSGTAVAVSAPAVEAQFALQQTSAARPAPMPYPMPSSQPGQPGEWRESYFQNNARGMIDAQTGAVIRFTRPVRHFYRDWNYQPTPMPTLMPKPSPVPSTAPSKEPEVVEPGVVEGSEGTGETDTANN